MSRARFRWRFASGCAATARPACRRRHASAKLSLLQLQVAFTAAPSLQPVCSHQSNTQSPPPFSSPMYPSAFLPARMRCSRYTLVSIIGKRWWREVDRDLADVIDEGETRRGREGVGEHGDVGILDHKLDIAGAVVVLLQHALRAGLALLCRCPTQAGVGLAPPEAPPVVLGKLQSLLRQAASHVLARRHVMRHASRAQPGRKPTANRRAMQGSRL